MKVSKVIKWSAVALVACLVLAPFAWSKYEDYYIQNLRDQGYYIRDEGLRAAIEQKDPEICGKIKVPFGFMEPGEKDRQTGCYSRMAEELMDINICKKYLGGFLQEICIRDIAVMAGDRTMCNQIDGQPTRRTCLERIE